jgi:hypothetical protein
MYYFYHPLVAKVEVDPRDRKSRKATTTSARSSSADLLADCIPDIYASFQSVSEAILKGYKGAFCIFLSAKYV